MFSFRHKVAGRKTGDVVTLEKEVISPSILLASAPRGSEEDVCQLHLVPA